jgi:hypothetical protein
MPNACQLRGTAAAGDNNAVADRDELTTSIVGIDFSNEHKSKSNRRMQIMLCAPGDASSCGRSRPTRTASTRSLCGPRPIHDPHTFDPDDDGPKFGA